MTPESKWIAAGTSLPEFGEYVFVIVGEDTILKGRLMRNGWTALFADGEKKVGHIRDVSHWLPLSALPSPPKPPISNEHT